jgi:ketosteroid isomerase-like protein
MMAYPGNSFSARNALWTLPLLLVIARAGAQEPQPSVPLDSMIAAERRFAARCQVVGIRASFLEFFADSALIFTPAPAPYRRIMANRPAPATPLARSLTWEPSAGGIAASGDFGFLMGPSEYTDLSAAHPTPSWGWYLSVWKKHADGSWRVVLDVGTDSPSDVQRFRGTPFTLLSPAPMKPMSADAAADQTKLVRAIDQGFGLRVEGQGRRAAYDGLLVRGARGLFEGVGPVADRDSLLALLSGTRGIESLNPLGGEVASSGDLGYTFGVYRRPGDPKATLGYYIRIWLRESSGWKIVVEKTVPAVE